jgi:hypothetical protein
MSLAKRMMFEEWEREAKRLEGKCHTCEEKLRPDEIREDECWSCFMERHEND